MIKTKPTEHLTGITISGDFADFDGLVDSIYNMTGIDDDPDDPYYGVKNRLLGICYDIRHAAMGTREVALEDNGMDAEKMKWQQLITPEKNVYYSVNVLFPEAIFIAVAVPHIYSLSSVYYGSRGRRAPIAEATYIPQRPFSDYIRDKTNLDVLCAAIWQALGEAIGDEDLEKIFRLYQRSYETYTRYATHYIDKCNIELMRTDVSKRKEKIKNIARRIIKKPQAYYNMERDLRYSAIEYGTNIYTLYDPRFEYPEEIEW